MTLFVHYVIAAAPTAILWIEDGTGTYILYDCDNPKYPVDLWSPKFKQVSHPYYI